jgi:hypothetical protein
MAALTLHLRHDVAESLRRTLLDGVAPQSAAHRQLAHVADELGLTFEPLVAQTDDPTLKTIFHAEVDDPAAPAAADRIRAQPGVESVFVKPSETPP